MLKVDNIDILSTNAVDFLRSNQQKFSLVFIDPPFRKGLAQQAAEALSQHGLTENALIYVEMEVDNNQQVMPSNWQLLKEKVAGQVSYQLYQNG